MNLRKVVKIFMHSTGLLVAIGDGTAQAHIDLSQFQAAISSAMGVQDIVTMVSAILGTAIAFALTWWGARKLVKSAYTALTKGKISF